MRFLKYLKEVLDTKIPFKVTTNSSRWWIAEFIIDDIGYSVCVILPYIKNATCWVMMFESRVKDGPAKFDITRSGNSFKVFATVRRILKKFISMKNPQEFMFTAKEKSRISLYNRFSKSIEKMGYKCVFGKKGDEKSYTFTKKDR